MNRTEESRANMLENVLCRILGVSDKAYQIRIWIEGKGPEWDDFDETTEYIISDGRDILKEYTLFNMTDEQHRCFKKFFSEYEAFCDGPALDHYYLPERFIDTPEWTAITELAKEVIKSFNYQYRYPSC